MNFIGQNLFIIIILGGGVFNVAIRIAQKAKEQRAKRESLHQLDRQKQESLRTGRPIQQPIARPQERDPQADRRERIEALRKERMDQLRALREKRAGGVAAPQSSISQSNPMMLPMPLQTQQRSAPRPQSQLQQQIQPRPQQTQRRTPNPAGAAARRPNVIATTQQVPQSRRRAQQTRLQPTHKVQERKAGQLETLEDASSLQPRQRSDSSVGQQSARSMLRSRSSIRQAMVLREILNAPIALRDQDIASGSLFS